MVRSGGGSVVMMRIVGGDQTDAIVKAWEQFIIGYATSGDYDPKNMAKQFAQFLAQLGDIGITSVLNQHVRDMVSAKLNLSSLTAGVAAVNIAKDFDSLYSDLLAGQTVGFTTFGVDVGNDNGLVFRLTYPAPGKPGVHNKLQENNNAPSIIHPAISLGLPQVKQGGQVQVMGNYFPAAFATELVMTWDRTVWARTAQTEVRWGPQGGPVADQMTNQFSFQANNLKPNTTYTFQVHECDTQPGQYLLMPNRGSVALARKFAPRGR